MGKKLICATILMMGLGLAPTASASLVALYQFDKDFRDTAGNPLGPFDAKILSGTPEVIDGRLVLKSAEQDTLTVGNKYPGSHPNLSLTVWLNVARSTGTDMRLMGKNDGSGDTPGWNIMVRARANESDTDGLDIRPALEGRGVGANWGNSILLPNVYVVGEWVHFGFTFDGTTKVANCYINGVLLKTATMAAGCDVADTTDELLIGRSGWGAGEWFDGMVDDLGIWDNVLTDQNMLDIHALGPFALDPKKARTPQPADGTTDMPREVALGWTPGIYAASHDVYFGTTLDDVNQASRTNPRGVLVSQGQAAATYQSSARLAFDTTYYWRIDEVNAPPSSSIFRGSVWSFRTEPKAYPVDGKTILATASSGDAGQGPENTINGSGLTNDLHSNNLQEMWLTAPTATGPAWIQFQFDRLLRLDSLWVWNQNGPLEALVGLGAKDVTIEYSTDGAAFQTLGTTTLFARATGKAGYAHNTVVDLGGVTAKYVKLTIKSNWGNLLPQKGLSEVRFFAVPVYAREPNPALGKTGVAVGAPLTWRAGREAAKHTVYLGQDPNTLGLAGTVTTPSYAASLNLASTYYWRVDEVNDTQTPTTWVGPVWSFTTQDYIVVDDFESYTDRMEAGQAIFQTWIDGYGTTTNGAVVGYENSPFAERTTVHSGSQSMPLAYDNTSATNSEAKRTFAGPQNWSLHGVKGLTLWFYGDPANVAQQMYVKINNTKIPYDGDAAGLKFAQWQMWYIDLTKQNVSSVTSLSVGFDRINGIGGAGKVLIDDIRLYPLGRQLVTPTDPGTTGLQAQFQFEGNLNDSSGKGHNGTAQGGVLYAAGKTGQALRLNGTDSYVEVGNPASLSSATDFTWSAWIKTASDGTILCRAPATGNWAQGGKTLFVINGILRTDAHSVGNLSSTAKVNDDQWHQVAMTTAFETNGTNDTTTLYIDGRAAATRSNWNVNAYPETGMSVKIGFTNTNFPTPAPWFMGLIDDVRWYNRVLSPAEVAGLAGLTAPFDKSF